MVFLEKPKKKEVEKRIGNMNTYTSLVKDYKSERPRPGDLIRGEILYLDEEAILLDIGAKQDAFVTGKELRTLEQDQVDELNVGDEIPVYVLRSQPGEDSLQVSIQKGMRQKDWDRAKQYMETNETVELEITGQNKGGVTCEFGQLRGFIPNSHIPGLQRTSRSKLMAIKEILIGEKLGLRVIEAEPSKRRLVFSGRGMGNSVIKRQLEELKVGEVVTGQVVHIVDYGAFVDIGGVDGLVHISELDWNEVEHPSEILDVGDEIQVLIQDVDVERERISLSRKELLPSPWDGVEDKYVVGELVEGTVIKVLDFGAFVRLSDGIVGLIHESELGIEGPLSSRDAVQKNEVVIVKILSIDAERRRMSLSLQVSQDEEFDLEDTQLGTMEVEATGP